MARIEIYDLQDNVVVTIELNHLPSWDSYWTPEERLEAERIAIATFEVVVNELNLDK